MILFVNPPSPFLLKQKVNPPLGLLYLATVLREHGIGACVLDLADSSDVDKELGSVDFVPELIGITVTTPQFGYAMHIGEFFRNVYPQVPIAVGGAHATVDPESCDMFDYIVIGEGESAIVDYRSWDRKRILRPFIADIDSIPYPDRSFIDIGSYRHSIDGEKATTVMTSRGCPYNCAFCSRVWGAKVRLHSPEYIVNEIRYLKRVYGYRAFMFFDDIFVTPRQRIVSTTELLKQENIIYRCFVRSDLVDRDLLIMLKESGCVEVGFGAESGSQKILDVVSKKSSVRENTQLVELARDVGIRVKAFMVIGLPGETHETAQETYDWLRNTAPDDWDISVYAPYKGSRIVNNPSLYDIEIGKVAFKDAWYKGTPGKYTSNVSTSGLSSAKIVWWRDKIEAELGVGRYKKPS